MLSIMILHKANNVTGTDEDLGEGRDQIDPFTAHFEVDLSEDMTKLVKQPTWKTADQKFPILGNLQVVYKDLTGILVFYQNV